MTPPSPMANLLGPHIKSLTLVCVVPDKPFPAEELAARLCSSGFTLAFTPMNEFVKRQAALILPDDFPFVPLLTLNDNAALRESATRASGNLAISQIMECARNGEGKEHHVLICASPTMLALILWTIERVAQSHDPLAKVISHNLRRGPGDVIEFKFGSDGVTYQYTEPTPAAGA